MVIVYAALFIVAPALFETSVAKATNSIVEMLLVIPPIFILIGLLDVWVSKETMVKMMGKGSGAKGVLLAFFLGSAAAGPLYGAFPVAITLLKKGSSFRNVLILIGAWSTTKIPLIMFEAASMGLEFTVLRFSLNIIGILGIAGLSERFLSHQDQVEIHERVMSLD